jgi:hypothetical protein
MSATKKMGWISYLAAAALPAALLTIGCGGHSTDTPSPTTDPAASYQDLSTDVRTAASQYGMTMMGSETALSDCANRQAQYDATVRPLLGKMVGMSGRLDDYMNHHGGAADADYRCVSASMMDELDYHRSIACTATDINAERNEVMRHVSAMMGFTGHMWDRCDQVIQSQDGAETTWEPALAACQSWNGHCTDSMHGSCSE